MAGYPEWQIGALVPHVLYRILLVCFLAHAGSASLILPDGTEVLKETIADSIPGIPAERLPVAPSGAVIALDYFYDHECQSCRDSLTYLRDYARKKPQVNIRFHNLAIDTRNEELFNQYLDRFNTTKISYPVIFLGDIALTGSSDIIRFTDPILCRAWQNKNE